MGNRRTVFGTALKQVKERDIAKELKEGKHNVVSVPIESVINPEGHNRIYINKESIKSLADNIKEVGRLIEPIVVRSIENNKYERIVGYRRLEAAKLLGWKMIDAVILNVDAKEAKLIQLSENIHRENLSPYDEVLGILEYISANLNGELNTIKKLLYKANNKNSVLSEDDRFYLDAISELLERVVNGKYKITTFSNRIGVLSMHPTLIDAMRQNKIKYSMAVEINKCKDKEKIPEVINRVFQEELTVREVSGIIKSLNNDKAVEAKTDTDFAYLKNVSKKKYNALPEEQKMRVDQLLKELKLIFEED